MATITSVSHVAENVVNAIDKQASHIPSHYYLWAGLGLLGASVALHFMNRKQTARVLGQLASPILMMAMYKTTPDNPDKN